MSDSVFYTQIWYKLFIQRNSDLLVKVLFSYMNYTCLNEMANTETATKSIAKSDHGYKKMS